MAHDDPANNIASRNMVLGTPELRGLIFSYLDPASVKKAALVSRQDIQLYKI